MNWKPTFAIVLLFVTLLSYGGGYLLGTQQDAKKRKKIMWLFVFLGLLPLLTFKYYNFLNESVSLGLEAIGLKFVLPGLNWAIPVGISFFTFQAVGYMLDVYHKRREPERNIVDYILFISFFPQVASGPISKADELIPQIKSEKYFDYKQAVSGLRQLLWGVFLKVVLADRIGLYVDIVFSRFVDLSGSECILGSLLYSIQIYGDFAGYSLMAIGLAKLLGYNLISNFNRPYFSVSITDFWRRWHISLSRWLKDYVYIPMGGSRCDKIRNFWNIFVTFLVSGLWHGANWTFILWGIIHGVCQIIEKAFGWDKKKYEGFAKFGRMVLTFSLVSLSWTIFRSPSISAARAYFLKFFSSSGYSLSQNQNLAYIALALVPFLLYELIIEFKPSFYYSLMNRRLIRWSTYVIIFCMIILFGVLDSSSFIYVNF